MASGGPRLVVEDAVRHHQVEVYVELEGGSKALHEGDGADVCSLHALVARCSPVASSELLDEDVEDPAEQVRVAGEVVADPARHAQDPLPRLDLGEHVVCQAGGRVTRASGGPG